MDDHTFLNLVRKLTKKSAFVQEKVRLKSVTAVHQLLQSFENIERLEMIHCRMLWRGLLNGFYLCDGFDNQQNLAKELAAMFWNIVVPAETEEEEGLGSVENRRCRGEKFVLWMNAFYAELTRQWKYLDKWMLSKFMSLVRYTLHESLKFLYLSYDLEFPYDFIKNSEAVKGIIHSSNFVEVLPEDEDSEAWNKLLEKRSIEKRDSLNSQTSDSTNTSSSQTLVSIIDFYNLMMTQNLLVPDGLHTPDIILFHVEVIVEEFVKMISTLIKETNPEAVVEALDQEQTKVFINILKPYMNTFMLCGPGSMYNKFTKCILEVLIQDTDHFLICQVLELLKVHNSKRKDVLDWIKRFESRTTHTKVASSDNPFDLIQEEMEQLSKDKQVLEEERQRRKDKKKRRKEKNKALKAMELETAQLAPENEKKSKRKTSKKDSDAMVDVEMDEQENKSEKKPKKVEIMPNKSKVETLENKSQNLVEKPPQKKADNKSVKKAIDTNKKVETIEGKKSMNKSTPLHELHESHEDEITVSDIQKVKPKKSKKNSKKDKSAEPMLQNGAQSISNNTKSALLSSSKTKKKKTTIEEKKSVKFSLENNEMRVYKVNSKVIPNIKRHRLDFNAQPGPSILRAPPPGAYNGKPLIKKDKKRKRDVEEIPTMTKRMKRLYRQ